MRQTPEIYALENKLTEMLPQISEKITAALSNFTGKVFTKNGLRTTGFNKAFAPIYSDLTAIHPSLQFSMDTPNNGGSGTVYARIDLAGSVTHPNMRGVPYLDTYHAQVLLKIGEVESDSCFRFELKNPDRRIRDYEQDKQAKADYDASIRAAQEVLRSFQINPNDYFA